MIDYKKAIGINEDGIITIINVNMNHIYKNYELYAPLTAKKYPLSVAVKENVIYSNAKPNERANILFKDNQYFGKIYIFLDDIDDIDDDDIEEEDLKELKEKYKWTFEDLVNDVYNNTLV